MNKQELLDYFRSKRFIIIMVTLIIMWLLLMLFFYFKADEITKHPCSVCAAKMGDKVVCTTGTSILTTRTFYPNYTIVDGGGYG